MTIELDHTDSVSPSRRTFLKAAGAAAACGTGGAEAAETANRAKFKVG